MASSLCIIDVDVEGNNGNNSFFLKRKIMFCWFCIVLQRNGDAVWLLFW